MIGLARALALLVTVAHFARHPGGARVTVSNVQPRVDASTGKILELGDGSIAKLGDKFYLYGQCKTRARGTTRLRLLRGAVVCCAGPCAFA